MTSPDRAPAPATGVVAAEVVAALGSADAGVSAYLAVGARLDLVAEVQHEDGAVAWWSRHAAWDRPWITAMGPDRGAVVRCVRRLVAASGPPTGITIQRQAFSALPAGLRPIEHWEWDWWYSLDPPPRRPGEDAVVELAPDDPRVPTLLAIANPEAMVRPGDRGVRGWFGITAPAAGPEGGPDELVSVAAVTSWRPGVPHLGSVATHPRWRGRGLSRDLCARLTRDALDRGAPAVTLGMHAANGPARAVYTSLGFTVGYRWASGQVPPTG